jgi:PAS domain S-box-containing protein
VYELFGYEAGQLRGRSAVELIHPEDVGGLLEGIFGRTPPQPGASMEASFRFRHEDGSWRWLCARGINLLDHPAVGGVVVNSRDITASRAAEEALGETQRVLATLMRNLPGMAYRCLNDVDWSMEFLSEGAGALTGYTPAELSVGGTVTFASLMHPGDVDRVWRGVQEAVAEKRPFELEYRIRTATGAERWVWEQGRGIFSAGGELLALEGFITDVTTRKEAEAAHRRLACIVESSEDAVISKSLDGIIQSWNTGAERIFGYTADEVVGRSVDLLVPPELAVDQAKMLLSICSGERVRHYETVRLRKDGQRIHISHTLSPIHDEHGNVTSASGISRDITDSKRAEAELVRAKESAEAANLAKSEFLSRMSHELRTPLNSVIGFTNVLRKNKRGALGEQEVGFLDRIASNGIHLLGLINDILDLAKVESGKAEVELRPVALEELVRSTLTELQGTVRGRPVELRSVIPPALAPLAADEVKLKQVLINLVGNALKFTPAGSVTLSVIADAAGRPLRIDVADTGIGVPRERLAAIFQPFEQAEVGTARHYGGTGLGLAISSSLCELMGYRLHVRSEVGEGSVFSIVLAASAADDEAPTPGRVALASPAPRLAHLDEGSDIGGRLVLVIDDEADSRLLITHHAEEFGCRTVTAKSGEEGLRLARELRPDLITLDLLMPGLNGWNTLRELRADPELRDIPVVVVSMVAGESRRDLDGAAELVNKPVSPGALQAALRRAAIHRVQRALVVEADPAGRRATAALLRADGVEVRTAADAQEALGMLEGFAPELVLVDTPIAGVHGRQLLRALRERSPRGAASPVRVGAVGLCHTPGGSSMQMPVEVIRTERDVGG